MTPKLILITGGANGIGKSIADALLKKNQRVITTSRSAMFNATLDIDHNTLCVQQLDVTNESSIEQFFNWLFNKNLKLDVLINNAGVGIFKSITETSLGEWEHVLKVNLTGAFSCSKICFSHMKSHDGGRILNIGSVADLVSLPNNAAYAASKSGLKSLSGIINEEGKFFNIFSAHISLGAARSSTYAASKHGVLGYTKSIAAEWSKYGITCNAICPGYVNTKMGAQEDKIPNHMQNICEKTPLGRLATPSEIANLTYYLLLEDLAFINGTSIVIDGGLSCHLATS